MLIIYNALLICFLPYNGAQELFYCIVFIDESYQKFSKYKVWVVMLLHFEEAFYTALLTVLH